MESSGRTLVCSVLFLDIVEYSKKPVSEQLQLKQEFNRELTKSLEQVPPRDRIILDTGDGAAVTFMGDPEDALFAAMAMRDSAGALAVRLGVTPSDAATLEREAVSAGRAARLGQAFDQPPETEERRRASAGQARPRAGQAEILAGA